MNPLGWSQRLPAPLKLRSRPECLGIFPTISYQNCWLESVRWDLTEARKGSSYAKHCILLIAFAVEIGPEKIPLPAPMVPTCFSDCAPGSCRGFLFYCAR